MKNLKQFLKKNKKLVTMIGVAILILICIILIYKIFFGSSSSDRYEGINSHKLEKTEIADIKKTVNDLDNVKNVKVYIKSKIIRILVNLKSDVDFDVVKDVANKTIGNIEKENLKFYDVEFFVSTESDSKVYPKIGYKHKSSDKFVW